MCASQRLKQTLIVNGTLRKALNKYTKSLVNSQYMCKLYQVSTQEPVRFKNLKYTYKCSVLFHTVCMGINQSKNEKQY